jgi:pSer/pThr/pTyr-binding forkhead associated (FHA) protein
MMTVTFQVLEGIDRGRIFRDLPTPVTIGREEGNLLRLNDERVSRFHAKVQQDNGDIILTDLESTNGTRVNGKAVQIRRLRPGDRILVGRSLLLFGSPEEIWARKATIAGASQLGTHTEGNEVEASPLPATMQAKPDLGIVEPDLDFNLSVKDRDEVKLTPEGLFVRNQPLPPLPLKMTPAQAARVAEIFDLLHRGLASATENIEANDDGTQVQLTFADWQKVLAIQMLLAIYQRAVTDPDSLNQ